MKSVRHGVGLAATAIIAWANVALAASGIDGPLRAPDGEGRSEVDLGPADVMTDSQRSEMLRTIRNNVRELEAQGKLAPPALTHPLFAWPLRLAGGLSDPGYHYVYHFVDQNPAFPGLVRDYNCGARTYDITGYNHSGTDYLTWPFPWYRMDHDLVEIVAAAAGQIVYKIDGNFDRSCGWEGAGDWNGIGILHADGSVAFYGHTKNGSLTAKGIGESVAQGEFLGIVGSSGRSYGPHLHFEVLDSAQSVTDPYQGPCNVLSPDSWWIAQRPYYDSALNRIATGFNTPTIPPCPGTESPNESNSFGAGATVYFLAYYRDQLFGQLSQYRILRPDSSVYAAWPQSVGQTHLAAGYWYWYFSNFAPSGPAGTWRFEATYLGQTYTHPFTIELAGASGRVPDHDGPGVAGLRAARAGGDDITLTWSPSCLSSDIDYAVYEGDLHVYYSHEQRLCSTDRATTATLTTFLDDLYYIVVPTSATREGSYGTDTLGAERPLGLTPCLLQLIAACP